MNIRKIVSSVVIIIPLIAAVFYIMEKFPIPGNDEIQKISDEEFFRKMNIDLREPLDETEVSSYVIEISGKISVEGIPPSSVDIRKELIRRERAIVSMVRPLGEPNLWFAQTKPSDRQNGKI